MYRKLFIDSSIWITYATEAEIRHKETKVFIKKFIDEGVSLFTSNDVIDETVTRLTYTVGLYKTGKFFELLQDNFKKESVVQLWVDEQLQHEAWELLKKFREHKLSFTDATSIAIMKRFNLNAIVTFDADFKKVGIRTLP